MPGEKAFTAEAHPSVPLRVKRAGRTSGSKSLTSVPTKAVGTGRELQNSMEEGLGNEARIDGDGRCGLKISASG
jgi:hypothetical protein